MNIKQIKNEFPPEDKEVLVFMINNDIKIARLIGKAANGDGLFIKMYNFGKSSEDGELFTHKDITAWMYLEDIKINWKYEKETENITIN